MTKVTVNFDKPKDCNRCPLFSTSHGMGEDEHFCNHPSVGIRYTNYNKVPHWCPFNSRETT